MTKDTLFYNANLAFPAGEGNEAILISDGKITAIGSHFLLSALCKSETEQIDLEGKTILPGLTDFHLHLRLLADRLDAVDCAADSLDEVLRRVKKRAETARPGEWIIGYGWNQNDWQPSEYGTAAQLDAVSPNNPVLLHAISLHAAWANSQALTLAGISAEMPDPPKGRILRDGNGQPTGILLEYAVPMLEKHIPQPRTEQIARRIQNAQAHLHSFGITGVHDFDRFPAAEALLQLVDQDLLRLRVSQNLPSEEIDRVLQEGWREKLNRPPYLQPGWLKLFADGALGPRSAALLQPYENTTESGMLLLSAWELADIGIKAAQDGWPLTVHAIGDRAVREVIDGYEMLRCYEAEHRLPHLPHRIEHIQLIHPDDLMRMKKLNLIASVQPTHATSDMVVAQRYWGARCEHAYAYQSMLDQGLTLRFGSDAPVESANPFEGLFAATTRQRFARSEAGIPLAATADQAWYPDQCLSLENALKAFTLPLSPYPNQASLMPLSPGSPADLIVLEENPCKLQPHELHQLLPIMTMVGGEIVYSR